MRSTRDEALYYVARLRPTVLHMRWFDELTSYIKKEKLEAAVKDDRIIWPDGGITWCAQYIPRAVNSTRGI